MGLDIGGFLGGLFGGRPQSPSPQSLQGMRMGGGPPTAPGMAPYQAGASAFQGGMFASPAGAHFGSPFAPTAGLGGSGAGFAPGMGSPYASTNAPGTDPTGGLLGHFGLGGGNQSGFGGMFGDAGAGGSAPQLPPMPEGGDGSEGGGGGFLGSISHALGLDTLTPQQKLAGLGGLASAGANYYQNQAALAERKKEYERTQGQAEHEYQVEQQRKQATGGMQGDLVSALAQRLGQSPTGPAPAAPSPVAPPTPTTSGQGNPAQYTANAAADAQRRALLARMGYGR